jgi:hypothetical protein
MLDVVIIVELKSVQSDGRNGCMRLKPEKKTTASEKKEQPTRLEVRRNEQ